ncbi:family 26 endoglucanase H/Glycosyl hydrolase [Aspergillus falconensis]
MSLKVDGFFGSSRPSSLQEALGHPLYDCITRVHNLRNLLWVCNTADPDWYPGNDKCDIATVDHYADAGDYGVLEGKSEALQNVTRGERVLALAEVGSIPDPNLQADKNVNRAYWMTWNDVFIKDGMPSSRKFLQNTFNNSRVVIIDH